MSERKGPRQVEQALFQEVRDRQVKLEQLFKEGESEIVENARARELGLPQLRDIIAKLRPHLLKVLAQKKPIFNDPDQVIDPDEITAIVGFRQYSIEMGSQVSPDLQGRRWVVKPECGVGVWQGWGRTSPSSLFLVSDEALVRLLVQSMPKMKKRQQALDYFLRADAPLKPTSRNDREDEAPKEAYIEGLDYDSVRQVLGKAAADRGDNLIRFVVPTKEPKKAVQDVAPGDNMPFVLDPEFEALLEKASGDKNG